MLNQDFFSEALAENIACLVVKTDANIRAKSAGLAVVVCKGLDVEEFARLQRCTLSPEAEPSPVCYVYWGGENSDRLYRKYEQVVWEVTWQENGLRVIHMEWETKCGTSSRDWVVAKSTTVAEEFILEVARTTHAPSDSVLVFSNGRWSRSHSIYQAMQTASFDNLILAEKMKEEIRDDFLQFLNAEERFAELGVAWKRGALIIGPPGNGKTHCVRALVKQLGIPSLYVQSLSHHYYTAEQMWQEVFDRARGLSPCVLVLEDLDALVTDENRSYFLNQLDGFEQNHGMIVLATTNHPDRIDAAIIERPSRFDRKYHFNLPDHAERLAYLDLWRQQLEPETGLCVADIEIVAADTEGFSFAYLKELVISAVMKWMADPSVGFAFVMSDQVLSLQKQMKTSSQTIPAPT